MAAACALAACIPSAGLAVSALDAGPAASAAHRSLARFTPATVDPRIAQLVARTSSGKARLMRFTPAGVPSQASGPVTVAVRVDEGTARAVSVRTGLAAAAEATASAGPALRIAPMRYNLGLARGYQGFAKAAPTPVLSRTLSDAAIPDLATFRPATGVAEAPSRFVPRSTVTETPSAAAAPQAIETRTASPERAVDVAGSYRLTRNIDVTAGVRYSSERDRLAPLADTAKKDNQAVYVGTQFRF
jgi:hypothetical protein